MVRGRGFLPERTRGSVIGALPPRSVQTPTPCDSRVAALLAHPDSTGPRHTSAPALPEYVQPHLIRVMTLEAIRYRPGSLQILNQLLLPHETVYDEIRSVRDGYEAIKSMKVTLGYGRPGRRIHCPISLAQVRTSRSR